MYVLIFTTIVSEKFLILRRIHRDIIINVKFPTYSQLNRVILLCDIIPDGKSE
jgi:hypothetical protein